MTVPKFIPFEEQYLTFEALEDATFSIPIAMDYSLDNGSNWISLEASTETPTIHAGEKILWKKSATAINKTFTATGAFKVYGNIMSLLYSDNFIGKVTLTAPNTFKELFKSNTYLTDASNLVLPATTVTNSAYMGMFSSCSNLVSAPKELPDSNNSSASYSTMFAYCSKLENAPVILVKTANNYAFQFCFRSCSKLKYLKCLITNRVNGDNATYLWLIDAASGGTFVKDSSMSSWPRSASGIPSTWTSIDA